MLTTVQPSVSFAEADDRSEAMHSAIDEWLNELTALVSEAQASQAFQERLERISETAERFIEVIDG